MGEHTSLGTLRWARETGGNIHRMRDRHTKANQGKDKPRQRQTKTKIDQDNRQAKRLLEPIHRWAKRQTGQSIEICEPRQR